MDQLHKENMKLKKIYDRKNQVFRESSDWGDRKTENRNFALSCYLQYVKTLIIEEYLQK